MRQAVLVGLSMLLAAFALAQDQRYAENVSVGYVMVPFTVFGTHNAPRTDVQEKDVEVYVDGVRIKSDMFERALNAPISYTIVLDGSGSMGLAGKMEAARAAVDALLAHRQENDDFALYVFDDKEAHEVVPFTTDGNAIQAAMRSVKPFGKTAFFDALATMPERSRLGRNPTRAIILLSDGIDNNSHLTREQLAAQLEGVAIPIYALGIREPSELSAATVASPSQNEALSDIQLLDEISNLTGGRLFLGNEPQQLAGAVDSLNQNLRAQYLVGFTPTGKGAVKYRRISLKVAGRVRSVRVRAGYRGTEPPVLAAEKVERKKSS
ncbi:MAG TPA: VWA domain-containing protein [Thermoanaerobaculia bacterium]|nr:VWA domain-containing protein [Thermoanaerobaculia bacterium]